MRFHQHILVEPHQSTTLTFLLFHPIHTAFLFHTLVVVIHTTDVVAHMSHVATHLTYQTVVGSGKVIAHVSFFVNPLRELLDDALQVADAVVAGFHGVVAQVFSLCTRVVVVTFTTKPQARILLRLDGLLVERQSLFLFSLGIREIGVAPFDSPFVVVVDAREDAAFADVVLRLSHIVEAGIVHDGSCVSVFLHPFLVAQLLHRCSKRSTHVVAQTEGVSHLVRRNETDELSHQFIVELQALRTLIHSTCLHHVPVVNQLHHVVVPADVGFQNLSRTRVAHMRTVGIRDRRSQIANHTVAGIFETHAWVVRPFLCHDGILPTCFLECFVPVLHTLNEILAPLLRRGWVDVIHNLLLWFHEFTPAVFFHVLFPWFQSPTSSHGAVLHVLLFVGIFAERRSEITHARVELAIAHWFLW